MVNRHKKDPKKPGNKRSSQQAASRDNPKPNFKRGNKNRLERDRSNSPHRLNKDKPPGGSNLKTGQPKKSEPSELIRLNKYIANSGVCSRRDADKLIESGLIQVNGKTITDLGTKIVPTDTVHYDNRLLKIENKYYILLNKPKGYITTTDDPQERKTVMFLTQNACKERIYPVGRLDKNTTGLLLLTNDGDLAKKLTHPKHQIKKIYHVVLDKNLARNDFTKIELGITLDDGLITVDKLAYVSPDKSKKEIGIEIHSGKNRIIRRLFESLGYKVSKLDRVSFAGLTKKDIPRGKWRHLTDKEIGFLKMI
jgi:23S rRNA pseudouridine2605 synthase